jgi:hypothetical protein
MKKWVFIFVLILFYGSTHASVFAESAKESHKNSIYGKTGFSAGGLALGGAWEHNYNRTLSLGGYLHIQPKDDKSAFGTGITALGGFVGAHFFKRNWDFYIQPGFGMVMADFLTKKETALGPSLNMGIKYQYSKSLAFGMERSTFYGWFASDYKGFITDVLLATVHFGM